MTTSQGQTQVSIPVGYVPGGGRYTGLDTQAVFVIMSTRIEKEKREIKGLEGKVKSFKGMSKTVVKTHV